jgi:hypothetical protein
MDFLWILFVSVGHCQKYIMYTLLALKCFTTIDLMLGARQLDYGIATLL